MRLKPLSRPLNHYLDVLSGLCGVRVGIVGDLVLDRYIFGTPRRLSREAPIPIIEYEDERAVCGGMANTAFAILALGASPLPFGLIGKDEDGECLKQIFHEKGISTEFVFESDDYRTVTKTRVMAGGLHTAKYQVARIDRGVPLKKQDEVVEHIAKMIKETDDTKAWVISDYGYGLANGVIRQALKEKAEGGEIVVASSRYRIHEFSNLTAVTLNEEEALEFGKCVLNFESDLNRIGKRMLDVLHLKATLITQGSQGMTLFVKGGEAKKIPVAGTTDIVDVSGAGDMVVATFVTALATGCDFVTAAELANVAASVVVMKRGTAVAYASEVESKLREVAESGKEDSANRI